MEEDISKNDYKSESSFGYHEGSVDSIISVEDVNRRVNEISETISNEKIETLCQGDPILKIEELCAGYGKMEILHDFNQTSSLHLR